jgi:hypothetical protein
MYMQPPAEKSLLTQKANPLYFAFNTALEQTRIEQLQNPNTLFYYEPVNRSGPSSSQVNKIYRAVVPHFHNPTKTLVHLLVHLIIIDLPYINIT